MTEESSTTPTNRMTNESTATTTRKKNPNQQKRTTNRTAYLLLVGILMIVFGIYLGIVLLSPNPHKTTKIATTASSNNQNEDRSSSSNASTTFTLFDNGDFNLFQNTNNTCIVCGDGKEVGDPNAIFAFPGQPSVTCGVLEEQGFNGELLEDQCDILPTLIDNLCDCRDVTQKCSVCGEGLEVGNPDAIFSFPSQPSVTCGDLEESGFNGNLNRDQCTLLPDLINSLCECQPIAETPSTAPSVTNDVCVVCGDGKQVGAPDAIFSFPSLPPISCGDLEEQGANRQIPPGQCALLPVLIANQCDCQPVGTPCSVCGEGQQVGFPLTIVSFPGLSEEDITCGDLQDLGAAGGLTATQCAQAPSLIASDCGCTPIAPVAPSLAPIPTRQPTAVPTTLAPVPTAPPTLAPPTPLPPTPLPTTPPPTLNPTRPPTLAPTVPPTPAPSEAPSYLTDACDYNLRQLLPFLQSVSDSPFYMVEVLTYRERESDWPYTSLLNQEIFPKIGAQVVANGTILFDKDFTVVRYPNGTIFREILLESTKVQQAYIYRKSAMDECHAWATTLVPKAEVPPGLTEPPLAEVPFPPPPGTPLTLFFHAIFFRNRADYSAYPNVPPDQRLTTGRQAVAKFDELATPLKADVNGMRAVAWLNVQVIAIGNQRLQQVRVETVPTLEGLGEAMMTDTWILASSHREAGVTPSTLTNFANATTQIISQYDGMPTLAPTPFPTHSPTKYYEWSREPSGGRMIHTDDETSVRQRFLHAILPQRFFGTNQ